MISYDNVHARDIVVSHKKYRKYTYSHSQPIYLFIYTFIGMPNQMYNEIITTECKIMNYKCCFCHNERFTCKSQESFPR